MIARHRRWSLEFEHGKPARLVCPAHLGPPPKPLPPRIPRSRAEKIIVVTCIMFDVTRDDLRSADRHRIIVDARAYAAVRLHAELKMSKAQIGRLFHRDPTTIMSLLRRAAA